MSVWTHINGCIRFDWLRSIGLPELDFEGIIGKTASFEDDQKKHDECNVPCGSEGSLQYHVWVNPSDSAASAYTVSIFGDLRDYEDLGEIEKWFREVINRKLRINGKSIPVMIRAAVLEAEVESRGHIILSIRHDLGNKDEPAKNIVVKTVLSEESKPELA